MLIWVLRGDLKGETGSLIKGTQNEALQTKQHATKILQTEREGKYRLQTI
jgi:hypothetical protein